MVVVVAEEEVAVASGFTNESRVATEGSMAGVGGTNGGEGEGAALLW